MIWPGFGEAYGSAYLDGIRSTLILAVVATVIGCIIGLICGILNTIPLYQKRSPAQAICAQTNSGAGPHLCGGLSGYPMVLQAVFIYYGLPYFSNNTMRFDSIWMAAILIVSINTGRLYGGNRPGRHYLRGPGQTEGARPIGMTHVQIMTNVILPQAFRNIIPQIGNNFIINIKDTSVMFIIGFTEFFAFHRYITGVNNLYFPSAAIEMIGYLCMTLIASFLLRWLEKHMDGNDSYELVQDDSLALSAGTYQHPDRGTPFDERNPEAQKSMLREELRRQAERDAAVREGQKAETRRAHGNETRNQDGGDQ